jgi:hypothetical protein
MASEGSLFRSRAQRHGSYLCAYVVRQHLCQALQLRLNLQINHPSIIPHNTTTTTSCPRPTATSTTTTAAAVASSSGSGSSRA